MKRKCCTKTVVLEDSCSTHFSTGAGEVPFPAQSGCQDQHGLHSSPPGIQTCPSGLGQSPHLAHAQIMPCGHIARPKGPVKCTGSSWNWCCWAASADEDEPDPGSSATLTLRSSKGLKSPNQQCLKEIHQTYPTSVCVLCFLGPIKHRFVTAQTIEPVIPASSAEHV